MFYEEATIDGVRCYRTLPNAEFTPLSREDLTLRIVNLEAKLQELQDDPRLQLQPAHIQHAESVLSLFQADNDDPADFTREEVEAYQMIRWVHLRYTGNTQMAIA